jgi:iron(III) transport system substrate-binding protein
MRSLLVILVVFTACSCEREPSGSAAGASGSTTRPSGEVVIYSSIDEPYLRPLMQRFEKQTGITVRVVTDTEATKSSALVERILAEKDRPQADVYWGNEIFHTINLAEQGAFDPYRPTTANDVPARWRAPNDLYTDVGLRARMIAISTRTQLKDLVAGVRGMNDLTVPALKGKIGVCHPAFGTASGHFAALYILWGKDKLETWLRGLKSNEIKLLGGNSAVADQVAAGTLAAGPIDNDDVNNAKADGQPLEGVVPDQDTVGTLLIPGTVALVHGCRNPDNARKLIDFICDPAVEKELIAGRYLAYSVRDTGGVKGMDVDYVRVAHAMKDAVELSLTILQDRKPMPATTR